MMPVGLFLLFFGYTLIYSGVKNVSVWDEIAAGFGGPLPDPSKAAPAAEPPTRLSLWGSFKQVLQTQLPFLP